MGKLKFLVVTRGSVGHLNACVAIATGLIKRGHQVVFFIEESLKGKFEDRGFGEYTYKRQRDRPKLVTEDVNPHKAIAELLYKDKILGGEDIEEQYKAIVKFMISSDEFESYLPTLNENIKKAMIQVQPDCFIVASFYQIPIIHYSDIPWIRVIGHCPQFFTVQEKLPPGGCDSDPSTWEKYRKCQNCILYSKEFNNVIETMGYERYPHDEYVPNTQLLTVYAYPKEMTFPQINSEWFNLEVFNRVELKKINLKMIVPEGFLEDNMGGRFSGKIIYVTLGTLGSLDLSLMERLISVLQNTNHKYIVCKGARYSEYELGPNMWGESFLPQAKIIPNVDLVIAHGGNRTLTETFALGKPMIVMPLFMDHYDNATRIEETNLGAKILPYSFSGGHLVNSIEALLNDTELQAKLEQISKRIQSSTLHEQLCEKIEKILA